MKIKALASICKAAEKTAFLFKQYDENGNYERQYISEGRAIYPADNLPEMDEELLLTIFDVPGKDKADWNVLINPSNMPDVSFDPYVSDEELLRESLLNITYRGKYFKVLFSDERTVFIDPFLLKPIDDIRADRELYLRKSGGIDYIVAKYGFIVNAVIFPEMLISEDFMKGFGHLYSRCRTEAALADMEAKRKALEAEEEDIPGQQNIEDMADAEDDFDPETGEILEH